MNKTMIRVPTPSLLLSYSLITPNLQEIMQNEYDNDKGPYSVYAPKLLAPHSEPA
jgi:hypothetical protein